MHCKICGKKSDENRLCKECIYFLGHGANEETLRIMYSDDNTKKVWEENKAISQELADAYYDSVLDGYRTNSKKDSKENFGYNTFADGATLALDIVMPMIDKDMQEQVKNKIKMMVEKRQKINKRKNK